MKNKRVINPKDKMGQSLLSMVNGQWSIVNSSMNTEQLLKKFYEGISTPEEEQFLTEYFLNEAHIDERWKDDQHVFRLLHDTQIHVPAGVSERLEETIRQMTSSPEMPVKDSLSAKILLNDRQTPSPKSQPRRRTLYYWISSAAAVACLCIGLFFTTRELSHPKMADTFSDPEEAALVARQTLAFMSTHLNNGLNKVAEAEQELEKVNQLLNKHLNK